jgi:hypothetical protein
MSDELQEELLTVRLRQARFDCLVLADVLDDLAEGRQDEAEAPVRRVDRVYAAAHLLTLVAQHLEGDVYS